MTSGSIFKIFFVNVSKGVTFLPLHLLLSARFRVQLAACPGDLENITMEDGCSAWFDLASSCLSDSLWELAVKHHETSLSHRTCPWGGHLLKFDSRNLFIQDAPVDPSHLFVRPEVRGQYEGHPVEISARCKEVSAPGDAMLERRTRMWVVRMAWILFGHCRDEGHGNGNFYDFDTPHTMRHQLRRNFPQKGDASYAGQGCLWLSRPEDGSEPQRFRVVLVLRTPHEQRFGRWAMPFISMITDMTHKATLRVLNSRAYQEMRRIDRSFYMVLTMRSFNRGPPMIPYDGEDTGSFSIAAGQMLGLPLWTRFHAGNQRFHLGKYLQCFMKRLGHKLTTYENLDGRRLVSYQCVVIRSEWEKVKPYFWEALVEFEAFRIQKAAYRHANGGSSAPTLTQDAQVHLLAPTRHLSRDSDESEASAITSPLDTSMVRTVVRNTFLELDEGRDVPPMRRTRSDLSGDIISLAI
eukprot:symbB.v1.2.026772.t1/scaffold2699.1/size140064/7